METKSDSKLSFDTLYDLYANKVRKIARYYIRDDYDAVEDVFQDVFMKLYINIDNINEDAIEAWIKTTTRRRALNYFRDKKYEIPDDQIEQTVDSISSGEGADDEVIHWIQEQERKELAVDIYDDLCKKNPVWYEAVTGAYLLEKPQKEVAENLGISDSAMRMTLQRAKEWMRKRYKKKYDRMNKP